MLTNQGFLCTDYSISIYDTTVDGVGATSTHVPAISFDCVYAPVLDTKNKTDMCCVAGFAEEYNISGIWRFGIRKELSAYFEPLHSDVAVIKHRYNALWNPRFGGAP